MITGVRCPVVMMVVKLEGVHDHRSKVASCDDGGEAGGISRT